MVCMCVDVCVIHDCRSQDVVLFHLDMGSAEWTGCQDCVTGLCLLGHRQPLAIIFSTENTISLEPLSYERLPFFYALQILWLITSFLWEHLQTKGRKEALWKASISFQTSSAEFYPSNAVSYHQMQCLVIKCSVMSSNAMSCHQMQCLIIKCMNRKGF